MKDRIGYDEPMGPTDSGFSVIFSDAPDPDDLPEVPALPEGVSFVCLSCLLDDYAEIGRGLDIAREYGAADLEDGEWVAGDVSRLEGD